MLETAKLSSLAILALENAKAVEIKVIDVRNMTDITDQMIICHGTSSRHVQAIARQLSAALAVQDVQAASIEGEDHGEWILLDYVNMLVHIMKPETRKYYDLESLWDVRLVSQHETQKFNSA